jgi:hypothetical protein
VASIKQWATGSSWTTWSTASVDAQPIAISPTNDSVLLVGVGKQIKEIMDELRSMTEWKKT